MTPAHILVAVMSLLIALPVAFLAYVWWSNRRKGRHDA
jgi:cbb3-type cytochrome oxidase subunit 3